MKNKNYLIVILLFTFSFLISCGELVKNNPIKGTNTEAKWVYVEVETIMKKDTTISYLYGKVKESVISNLDNKNLKEIFKISDIRYFNPEDKLQLYEDEDESGILFYRIESIKKLSVYSRDPIYSFDKEDLHENTLQLISK